MKLVATVKDNEYGYIQTFIMFLDNIVTVIGHLFEVIGTAMNTLGKKDE